MSEFPEIVILCGGTSQEREVSLVSGHAVEEALIECWPNKVQLIRVDEDRIPAGLDPDKAVIFPVFHGTFGEDGGIQALLDQADFEYAGCSADGSRISFDKVASKENARACGLSVAPDLVVEAGALPSTNELIDQLGESLVIKPVCQGSSVGLSMVDDAESLSLAMCNISSGRWLIEKKIEGRELTVGIVQGRAMGIVEIVPQDGVYDYEHKYTPGLTCYEFPAAISDSLTKKLQSDSERIFNLNKVRDFARVDFILSKSGTPYFLEINTIPGLTPTSLLPKSALCLGHDFVKLVELLVLPAVERFRRRSYTS